MKFLPIKIMCFCLCFAQFLLAQTAPQAQRLTFQDAVKIALTNNHDLKIQRQSILLATNKITKGNAGLLPTVDAVGTGSYTNNFANLDLRTFQPEPPIFNVDESGVETTTFQAGVEANYMLWDGGQGKVRYQLLEGLSEIEKAKQAVIINGIVEGIAGLFYEIVKLQNQMELIQENVELVRARIKKIEDRKAFGKANSLAILQAKTTLNQDLSTLDNIQLLRSSLLLDLKNLLNDQADASYILESNFSEFSIPELANIQAGIAAKNPQLQLIRKGMDLAEIDLLLAQKATKPTIVSFADAGYFWQKNDVQQLAKLRTIGATVGIALRYNLFDGGVRQNKIQHAQIARDLEQLKRQQAEDNLYKQAEKEILKMRLIKAQLAREMDNLFTYEENYQKVVERFKLGKLPEITLREAQLALTNSKLISLNLNVDFERAAVNLRRLMGDYIN